MTIWDHPRLCDHLIVILSKTNWHHPRPSLVTQGHISWSNPAKMNVSKLAGLDTFISYLISSYLSTRLLCARTLLSHAKNGSFRSFKKVVVWAYQHPFSFENLFPNFQIFLAQKDDRSVAEYFYAFELQLNYCFQLDSNEYHDGKIKNKGRCETTLSLNKVWWWEWRGVTRSEDEAEISAQLQVGRFDLCSAVRSTFLFGSSLSVWSLAVKHELF